MSSVKERKLFYDKTLSKIEKLCQRSSSYVLESYSFGSRIVNIHYPNQLIYNIIAPAFAHVVIPSDDKPDFTIYLADNHSCQSTLDSLPPSIENLEFFLRSQPVNSDVCVFTEKQYASVNMIDFSNRTAIFWAYDFNKIPWWFYASPLQGIFHCWLDRQQLQITHCGVVATPKGGVVFAGPGGAGKSTTTFTCVRGGMNFVAEDYGILDVSTAPRMYSLYNSGKFTPQTRSFFPEIETHVQPTRESKPAKAFMYYKDLFPNQLQSSTAIKAIFVLHQAAALETSLERSTEKEALIALMPSTLYQLPYVCHEGMRRISKLVESCPVYRLSLGTDLTKIVPVVHSFFDLEVTA